jgi:hypothetical protein
MKKDDVVNLIQKRLEKAKSKSSKTIKEEKENGQ